MPASSAPCSAASFACAACSRDRATLKSWDQITTNPAM
jgi:hypothetical protein